MFIISLKIHAKLGSPLTARIYEDILLDIFQIFYTHTGRTKGEPSIPNFTKLKPHLFQRC